MLSKRRLTVLFLISAVAATFSASSTAAAAPADADRAGSKARASAVPVESVAVPAGTVFDDWDSDAVTASSFDNIWDLRDGARYTNYRFAVFLEGRTGVRSDGTRRICVNSTLTGGANDGAYDIRLRNEYTPSARTSALSGWVSFPYVLNREYGYCFTSLPDYDRGDVFTVELRKRNTTNYYSGVIRMTQ